MIHKRHLKGGGREVEQFVIVNKYIQISGNVMVTYNLGQQDIVIRDTSKY